WSRKVATRRKLITRNRAYRYRFHDRDEFSARLPVIRRDHGRSGELRAGGPGPAVRAGWDRQPRWSAHTEREQTTAPPPLHRLRPATAAAGVTAARSPKPPSDNPAGSQPGI